MTLENAPLNILHKQMILCGKLHEGQVDKCTPFLERRINRLIDNFWSSCVARKHVGKKYPVKGRDNLTFLNTKLNEADKRKFEDWASEDHVVAAAIVKTFHAGYKGSMSWYADGEIWIYSLFPHYEMEENQGYALSSRAKDWYKAMIMTVYKHTVMSGGDWSVFDSAVDDEG